MTSGVSGVVTMSGTLSSVLYGRDDPMSTHEFATSYLRAGYSCIPIAASGEKKPSIYEWKTFQERRPTSEELEAWFQSGNPKGIALILGSVSNGLHAFDFESNGAYALWRQFAESEGFGFVDELAVVKTPRGYHVYLRLEEPRRREIVARIPNPEYDAKLRPNYKKWDTLIEFRGEGCYNLAPGSHPDCHPNRKAYEHVAGPLIEETALISREQIGELIALAKRLNEYVEPEKIKGFKVELPADDERPGTDFSRSAGYERWAQMLKPAGWEVEKDHADWQFWRRPGKDKGGSATLGFCKSDGSGLLFHVFSTEAEPFEADATYTAFAARTLLEFGGDWKACARRCATEGFGVPPSDEVTTRVEIVVNQLRGFPTDEARFFFQESRLREMRRADERFRKIFDMKRKSDFQDSYDAYVGALLLWIRNNFTGPEIVADPLKWIENGVRLTHDFLRLNGGPVEKAFDVEYMARKIAGVERYRTKARDSDEDAVREILSDEVGTSDEAIKAWLREKIRLPFISFCYSQEKGEFFFIMEDRKIVWAGGVSDILNSQKFQERMYEQDLKDYGYPGSLPKESRSKTSWETIVRKLYEIRQTMYKPKKHEELCEVLEKFVSTRGLPQDATTWRKCIPRNDPFVAEGKIWVNVREMATFASLSLGMKGCERRLLSLVASLGEDAVMRQFSGRDSLGLTEGREVQRRYWGLSLAVLEIPWLQEYASTHPVTLPTPRSRQGRGSATEDTKSEDKKDNS